MTSVLSRKDVARIVIPREVAESTPATAPDRSRGSCDCAQDDISVLSRKDVARIVIPREVAESTPATALDRSRGSCGCAQDDIRPIAQGRRRDRGSATAR
jgi:hypothetical protein